MSAHKARRPPGLLTRIVRALNVRSSNPLDPLVDPIGFGDSVLSAVREGWRRWCYDIRHGYRQPFVAANPTTWKVPHSARPGTRTSRTGATVAMNDSDPIAFARAAGLRELRLPVSRCAAERGHDEAWARGLLGVSPDAPVPSRKELRDLVAEHAGKVRGVLAKADVVEAAHILADGLAPTVDLPGR